MEDFRVKTGFRNHYKREIVRELLGWEGVVALYDLWSFCAESRTTGDLSGMSSKMIAHSAGYSGDPAKLTDTLLQAGFLEGTEGHFRVHGWAEHNAYVATHTDRKEQAKSAVNKRWAKRRNAVHNTDPENSITDSEISNTTSNTTSNTVRNTPSPSPSPSPFPFPSPDPLPEPIPIPILGDATSHKGEVVDPRVGAVLQHYRSIHPDSWRQTNQQRVTDLVACRFGDGFSPPDLCRAISGNRACSWHRERGIHGIEYILRDIATVEKFMTIMDKEGLPPPHPLDCTKEELEESRKRHERELRQRGK